MKKYILSILTLFIISFFSFNLYGCGEDKTSSTVMTLSLNPKVEFIIDKNDKVLTASALNNDGNFILMSDTFVGENYQTATLNFVELCYKYGYVLGNETQPINLAISGKDSSKIFNNVKESINSFLTQNNYKMQIKMEDFPSDYLKNSVKKAYLNMQDVNNLSENELINLLKDSRIETQNLYTQELKEFYYQDKAKEILKAEIASIKTYIQEKGNPTLNAILENVNTSLDDALKNIDAFSGTFVNSYMENDGAYRTKINSYIKDKKGLLEAKLSGAEEDVISAYTNTLDATTTELEDMYSTMSSHISTPLTSLISIRNTVFDGIKIVYSDIAKTISTASKQASENYNATFTSYNLLEKNDYWKNLAPTINN